MWLVSMSCLSALGSFRDLPGGRGAFVLDLRWLTQIEYKLTCCTVCRHDVGENMVVSVASCM